MRGNASFLPPNVPTLDRCNFEASAIRRRCYRGWFWTRKSKGSVPLFSRWKAGTRRRLWFRGCNRVGKELKALLMASNIAALLMK